MMEVVLFFFGVKKRENSLINGLLFSFFFLGVGARLHGSGLSYCNLCVLAFGGVYDFDRQQTIHLANFFSFLSLTFFFSFLQKIIFLIASILLLFFFLIYQVPNPTTLCLLATLLPSS